MNDTFRKFESESDILRACNELLKKEHLLDKLLKLITNQIRGEVRSKDTLSRSKVGSYFTSSTQQIYNYIDKNNITISSDLKKKLKRISFKADKVLRENIVLHTKPPLDVIQFSDVPVRHSYSSFGGREQRWGYGLHKRPFNEEGDSITIADMPPHYTQSIHNHTLSEYCFILDSRTEGIFNPGGKREKIYSTKKSEMFHFSATTPHTLKNPSNNHTRNMTFKQSRGLFDWRPFSNLNSVKIIRARVLKGKLFVINKSQTLKKFRIHDKYYNYCLEIIKLKRGTTFEAIHKYDQYIFVLNGKFQISHKNIIKNCKKNDFVVIDKNTEYKIVTNTVCRLYSVRG